ncbi:hypothetical protein ASD62_05715 [Phycicoccus sp. Root563]|uniref:ribonuclease D n=1 Tax=Phycicoccus sp. Root563 TaxID=1736562 RepID=UPI00070382E0|nr:ribonuclease D [Phycicoccus sp. Root563]KQZ88873.1 hypothetical protein ASD62_05715 [Phycicoccus sp. Root563]
MPNLTASQMPRTVRRGDASDELVLAAQAHGMVSIDTETTGLDPRLARLCTIQIHVPDWGTEVIQVESDTAPEHVRLLVESADVTKVFHHAVFDLGFLRAQFGISSSQVRCTKIAAKLLWPGQKRRQSLAGLTEDLLGEPMPKAEQLSDWTRPDLTDAQVTYAARDAEVLPPLLGKLQEELGDRDLLQLASACWLHIPTRVELEAQDFGDVFSY